MNSTGPQPSSAPSGASSAAALRALEAALSNPASECSGTVIGPYQLLQKLGEGGFGVVWMAEQHTPLRRRLALKIIKVGMDSEEVIARFEAERQALALMDHPNIARVFDAGATQTGRPFFAMELVRGVAITRYCDDNRLSAPARLRLFIAVCQAVQHAHQKGVIHRDLKPSNILVTLHDGVPVPKVIDFGIAKATDKPLTEKTLFTQFHAFLGTPAYTSPEQMEMSGLDVDTRSDIYSLGVILYELLAGRPPFDPEALAQHGLEAMRRTLREIDPPRPSTRLGTLSDLDRTTIATHRGTDAAKLSLLLRGDLDWVVMHCLEKDRTRRYETANALARDIERHLAHEPVSARPPSRIYRLRKFVRRHQIGVAATAAIAVSLVGGLVAASILLVRENAARARAVAAEASESKLRHQAEAARGLETQRASRTALALAEQFLRRGETADGLAYLVHVARTDAQNPTIGPRLASVLTSRNFQLPESAPVRLPSPALVIRHIDDGRTIAVLCADGTVAAISAATGETRLARLPSPPTTDADFVLTGMPFVFRCQDDAVRVFDFNTMQVAREFRFPKKTVGGITFNHATSIVLVHLEDDSLHLCDLATGQSRSIATGLARRIGLRFQVSRDGRSLATASASDREIQLRDTLSGDVRSTVPLSDGRRERFRLSPDGRRLATAQSVPGSKYLSLQLWSVPDGLPLSSPMPVPDSESGSSAAVFFSDDDRFLIFWGRKHLEVRDGSTGLSLAPPAPYEPAGTVHRWSFTRDGTRMLLRGANVTVWDLATGQIAGKTPDLEGGVEKLSIADDDQTMLTTSPDGYARVWDVETQQLLGEPVLQQRAAPVGSLSPDGRTLALGTDAGEVYRFQIGRGGARPLDLPWPGIYLDAPFMNGSPARVLAFRRDQAMALDISSGRETPGGFAYPVGIRFTATRDAAPSPALQLVAARTVAETMQTWKLETNGVGQNVTWEGVPAAAEFVGFSPRGDRVALHWGPNIGVWDSVTGKQAGPGLRVSGFLNAKTISFSPDGRLLAASGGNGEARVWEIATGREPVRLPSLGNFLVISLSFSPDGTRIAMSNLAGAARLFDAVTGQPASPLLMHSSRVHASFSPDGRFLETRAGRTLRLWDGHTGRPMGEITETDTIREADWDAGTTRLALTISGRTEAARIWDVRTLQPLTDLMPNPGTRIHRAVFSPDNRFIMTDTVDGYFHFWSVPPPLPAGTGTPAWLLDLATLCAGKAIDANGNSVAVPDAMRNFDALRRTVAGLAADAPLADWGRWFLADRTTRAIAPGFTLTPDEAGQFTARFTSATATRPIPVEDDPP